MQSRNEIRVRVWNAYWGHVTPWVGNFTEEISSVCNGIFGTVILVPNVYLEASNRYVASYGTVWWWLPLRCSWSGPSLGLQSLMAELLVIKWCCASAGVRVLWGFFNATLHVLSCRCGAGLQTRRYAENMLNKVTEIRQEALFHLKAGCFG